MRITSEGEQELRNALLREQIRKAKAEADAAQVRLYAAQLEAMEVVARVRETIPRAAVEKIPPPGFM